MSNYELKNGIMVPKPKPPTIEERRKAARDRYYADHAVCPQCGSDQIETTCTGTVTVDPDEHADGNCALCINCGWTGRVVDMVARAIED